MSEPIIWRVVSRMVGGVDWLLLGDTDNDDYRIGLTLVQGLDGLEVDTTLVSPCAVCGWGFSCHGGEDCHS